MWEIHSKRVYFSRLLKDRLRKDVLKILEENDPRKIENLCKAVLFPQSSPLETSGELGKTTLETSGEDENLDDQFDDSTPRMSDSPRTIRQNPSSPLKTSEEDPKTTLETSGEDPKTTLETSGEDAKCEEFFDKNTLETPEILDCLESTTILVSTETSVVLKNQKDTRTMIVSIQVESGG